MLLPILYDTLTTVHVIIFLTNHLRVATTRFNWYGFGFYIEIGKRLVFPSVHGRRALSCLRNLPSHHIYGEVSVELERLVM